MNPQMAELLEDVDPTLDQLVSTYEVMESAYGAAVASHAIYPEATNTSGIPDAACGTWASAR